MKRFFIFLFVSLSLMGMLSCAKGNESDYSKKIIGTWDVEEWAYYKDGEVIYRISPLPLEMKQSYTFNNDGTCAYSSTTGSSDGENSISSSQVVEYSIKGQYLMLGGVGYPLSFEGEKMIWTVEISSVINGQRYDKVAYILKRR